MTDGSERNIDRRGFIVTATGIAASWALPLRVMAQGSLDGFEPPAPEAQTLTVPEGWHMEFAEPETVATVEGTAGVDLAVQFAEVAIVEPDASGAPVERIEQVRTYNGQVPGPTFRLKPGDKLEFMITNQLPPSDAPPPPYENVESCHMLMALNVPGCFNTTNLHTHGLHASPQTKGDLMTGVSSDDVRVRIPPKDDPMDDDGWPSERDYCVWLPEFHAPGTHWYHAHVHGSTAIQVVNGLAGALIVEEPENQKIHVDKELIWIIQEIIGDAETVYANIAVPPGQPGAGMKPYGDMPPTVRFTVNSLTSSTIVMQPNEIQRWRFINATATPRGFMNVAVLDANDPDNGVFVDGVLHTIADDGITYYGKSPQPVVAPGKFLAAGNRTDFLAKFDQPGTYYVWKRRIPNLPTVNDLLAIVQVEGEALPDRPLPSLPGTDKAPCYLKPISAEEVAHTPRRTYEFGVLFPGEFGGFVINGEPYGRVDPDTGEMLPHPNTDLPLGNAEEWTLTNSSGAPHPYHIHVNPFQVIGDKVDPDGPDDETNWRWLDTIALPTNDSVRIRSRFLTYDGHFVMHCHILVHEDIGMMQDMTVVGDGYGPCLPVTECKISYG